MKRKITLCLASLAAACLFAGLPVQATANDDPGKALKPYFDWVDKNPRNVATFPGDVRNLVYVTVTVHTAPGIGSSTGHVLYATGFFDYSPQCQLTVRQSPDFEGNAEFLRVYFKIDKTGSVTVTWMEDGKTKEKDQFKPVFSHGLIMKVSGDKSYTISLKKGTGIPIPKK